MIEAGSGEVLWQLADLGSALVAIDPDGLKGVSVHASSGPVRDTWLERLTQRFGADAPHVTLPASTPEDRVIGGLDLAATLASGVRVSENGVLKQADGGVLVARMAERLSRSNAAHIASAIDQGAIQIERHGISRRSNTSFVLVLFDESGDEVEGPPSLLTERVAFHLELDGVSIRDADQAVVDPLIVQQAKSKLNDVVLSDEIARSIDSAALGLGVTSLRAFQFALRAAKALAALDGDIEVANRHAELAVRLVLSSRIRLVPETAESEAPPPAPQDQADQAGSSPEEQKERPLEDQLIEAARLTYQLQLSTAPNKERQRGLAKGVAGGRSGAQRDSRDRGRQVGSKIGDPRRNGRLDLLATLRAAAPWQRVRPSANAGARLQLRPQDFRLRHLRTRTPTVVIFVVDASGSLAMSRMAEAKGAVELLLSDCYTRRDQVALIAFRRDGADLLLSPTRSLVRVRRSLANLPAGGGTPLASGMAEAVRLAVAERSRGRSPFLVFLSDGKANISLKGEAGRDVADEDCHLVARQIRDMGFDSLFLDTSRRPSEKAVSIAADMGAAYRLLPYADSAAVSAIVGQLMPT